MNESEPVFICTTVGFGKVDASLIQHNAVWVCDYFMNCDAMHETLQRTRRIRKLRAQFERYKLLEPTIEFVENGIDNTLNQYLLRISTLVLPYHDSTLNPGVFALRERAREPEQVMQEYVMTTLNAGGQAIYDCFASAMSAAH